MSTSKSKRGFAASAGFIDLQPPVGMWMSGYAARVFPSVGQHDPITARALLMDDGAARVAIISCDLISFERETVEDLRARINERTGIPERNIVVACTHTHSGPSSMPFRGVLGNVDREWLARVKTRIVDLVCSLPEKLQASEFRYAQTNVPGIGRNRQDGSRGIDDQATIIGIDTLDGSPIATVLNFGCHAVVLGADNILYSADYPGAAVRRIESARGGVGLFLQGTIGDVNPAAGHGSFDLVDQVGTALADGALPALESAQGTRDVTLGAASGIMDCPLEPAPSLAELDAYEAAQHVELAKARTAGDRIMEGIADAMLDWASSARAAVESGNVSATTPAEIGIVRINDLLLVTAPFELYSDIGIAIKQALRPWKAAYVGVANGHLGYLATGWAKDQGGYGPCDAYKWSVNVVTGTDRSAGPVLVAKASELAGQVSSRQFAS
jgi:neutral ceramidase